MTNYIMSGDNVELAAPYAVLSGGGALIGTLFGVASTDLANAERGVFVTKGVFDITKTAAQTFAEGAAVYWDNSAKSVTSVSSGNTLIGIAMAAAAGGDATARVRIR